MKFTKHQGTVSIAGPPAGISPHGQCHWVYHIAFEESSNPKEASTVNLTEAELLNENGSRFATIKFDRGDRSPHAIAKMPGVDQALQMLSAGLTNAMEAVDNMAALADEWVAFSHQNKEKPE